MLTCDNLKEAVSASYQLDYALLILERSACLELNSINRLFESPAVLDDRINSDLLLSPGVPKIALAVNGNGHTTASIRRLSPHPSVHVSTEHEHLLTLAPPFTYIIPLLLNSFQL